MSNPVILAAKRTPIGKFFGGLSKVPSPVLGSYAIKAALEGVPGAAAMVDECIMGCVLQAGLGQNPARQAGLKAGLPDTLSAVTVNKVCGSGLEAVMQACRSIKAGDNRLVVAGGFENMTAAPHFARVREGVKYGPTTMEDVMAYDGLRCAFECWAMTNGADHIAKKFGITRAEQDRFSVQSHQRAAHAAKEGWFAAETVALTGEQCMDKRSPGVAADEGVRADTSMDSVGKLKAIPGHETITAANASQISDGAAALVVASADAASKLGAAPVAKVLAYHTSGVAPKEIFAAPITGVQGASPRPGLASRTSISSRSTRLSPHRSSATSRNSGSTSLASTSAAAASPWGTPSAAAAPACSPRSFTSSVARAGSGASQPCAWAAATAWPWSSRCDRVRGWAVSP